MGCALIFIHGWRDLQFNFSKHFSLRVFVRNLLRGIHRRNIFYRLRLHISIGTYRFYEQFRMKNFLRNFFIAFLSIFARNQSRSRCRRKFFSYFSLLKMFDLGLNLMSNKPTHYLIDYVNFYT